MIMIDRVANKWPLGPLASSKRQAKGREIIYVLFTMVVSRRHRQRRLMSK